MFVSTQKWTWPKYAMLALLSLLSVGTVLLRGNLLVAIRKIYEYEGWIALVHGPMAVLLVMQILRISLGDGLSKAGAWILNLVEKFAPAVGLFGTVCGIQIAFSALGGEFVSNPVLHKVILGLNLALETTKVGLALAIPAGAIYDTLYETKEQES